MTELYSYMLNCNTLDRKERKEMLERLIDETKAGKIYWHAGDNENEYAAVLKSPKTENTISLVLSDTEFTIRHSGMGTIHIFALYDGCFSPEKSDQAIRVWALRYWAKHYAECHRSSEDAEAELYSCLLCKIHEPAYIIDRLIKETQEHRINWQKGDEQGEYVATLKSSASVYPIFVDVWHSEMWDVDGIEITRPANGTLLKLQTDFGNKTTDAIYQLYLAAAENISSRTFVTQARGGGKTWNYNVYKYYPSDLIDARLYIGKGLVGRMMTVNQYTVTIDYDERLNETGFSVLDTTTSTFHVDNRPYWDIKRRHLCWTALAKDKKEALEATRQWVKENLSYWDVEYTPLKDKFITTKKPSAWPYAVDCLWSDFLWSDPHVQAIVIADSKEAAEEYVKEWANDEAHSLKFRGKLYPKDSKAFKVAFKWFPLVSNIRDAEHKIEEVSIDELSKHVTSLAVERDGTNKARAYVLAGTRLSAWYRAMDAVKENHKVK